MSNIFKNGGGAGIGSYVIVFKDGQLAPDTDPLKLWGAYESGEQVYISVIDEETQDALVPASGWIDADSKLHLVARDFDDDKTYSVVLEYAPIASEMHIEGDVEEGITGGGVSKEEVEEMIADKADLVNGKVPAEQLPSYVDDILEFPTLDDFPNPGEEGKIYVALDTNYTYRWSGSGYTQVGGSEVDLSDYYRKEEVNALLDEKADADNVYDKEQIDFKFEGYYGKSELDSMLETKASAADLATLDGAVSSLESDLAADEAEIALKANAADSVEVVPYQNQTPLTQEQINKALAGKLAILHNGRVYVPHYHSEAMVNFHCFEIGHNISDSENVAETMRSMEYVIILLIETGMLSDSGPMPVSSIGDYANNYLAMANAPVADGKRLIREGNLVANYYDKAAMDASLAEKADAPISVNLIEETASPTQRSGSISPEDVERIFAYGDGPVRFIMDLTSGVVISPIQSTNSIKSYIWSSSSQPGMLISETIEIQFEQGKIEPYSSHWVENISAIQPALVSGDNIKTINGESVLGSGDLEIKTEAKTLPVKFFSSYEDESEGDYELIPGFEPLNNVTKISGYGSLEDAGSEDRNTMICRYTLPQAHANLLMTKTAYNDLLNSTDYPTILHVLTAEGDLADETVEAVNFQLLTNCREVMENPPEDYFGPDEWQHLVYVGPISVGGDIRYITIIFNISEQHIGSLITDASIDANTALAVMDGELANNYYTRDEVDAAIAAAIGDVLNTDF